ncbi:MULTISPECIES: helix-turn-helix domain-containing protein [unclassified Mycolicibacterium]|uniref:helix-turn-helix domain-containing protein n=1 Tax=Mycolicibacterium sp. TY81 TaxID=2759662 RepID=UPI001BB432AD
MTEAQRSAAVALFDQGWGDRATATHMGVSRWAVRSLYRRWRLHGQSNDQYLWMRPGEAA